jgi:hypothetical protein
MTDTVAVALIAVSGTIGSGFLSYLAARRSTEVQLRAIGAEMHRLQETHAEEHRRERQAAYFALIAEMEQIRQLAYGLLGPVTIERFRELNSELGKAYTQVLFLGEESVIDVRAADRPRPRSRPGPPLRQKASGRLRRDLRHVERTRSSTDLRDENRHQECPPGGSESAKINLALFP